MAMQTSTTPIFYPDLCPNCSNYDSAGQKCTVAAASAGSNLPSEVMISEMTGLCPYFEPVASRPTINEVEPVEEAENVVATAQETPSPTREESVEKTATEAAMPSASEMEMSPRETTATVEPAAATPSADVASLDEAAQVVAEAEGAVPPELQASIPIEQAARIVSMPATIEERTTAKPAPATEKRPTMPESAPVGEARLPGEARIHCPKCKVENAANSKSCQNCGEPLLPAEGTGVRFLYFVFGVLFAAGFAYLFYQFYVLNPGSAPDIDFLNPVVLAVGAFASLIAGIVLAVRRTPEYEKYENRAKRHLGLNLWQSLADVNQAMKVAPEKKQGGLIKLRAQVFEKLGMADDAMRDRLVLITSPTAYKSEGETVSLFTGADSDVYARSRRKGALKAILQSGNVVAVGYCPKCKAVVELDADEHCKTHLKIKGRGPQYVITADVMKGKLAVLAKLERGNSQAAGQLTGLLASGQAVAQGYCPKCKEIMTLDVERKCLDHPKVKGKWVAYSVPLEAEKGKKAVQEEMKRRSSLGAKNIILILALALALIATYYLLTR